MGIPGDWISEDVRYKSGNLKKGRLNLITDVPGVFVGHCTLQEGNVQTGVTAILPHTGDVFHEKCIAAAPLFEYFITASVVQPRADTKVGITPIKRRREFSHEHYAQSRRTESSGRWHLTWCRKGSYYITETLASYGIIRVSYKG